MGILSAPVISTDVSALGTVLVKMNAISREDLEKAVAIQKSAGKNRKPLITTLIERASLAVKITFRGLKKLIEITIIELLSWPKGTFTLDMDAIAVSPECSYLPDKMAQEVCLDGQMILMDVLRIFDERERDRQSGKNVPSYEDQFADVITSERAVKPAEKGPVLTADDLGLADLDHLERLIPQVRPVVELFNPVEMHRQKIRETLVDFSIEEQETIVAFLEKSAAGTPLHDRQPIQERRAQALILFSDDEFIKHSVMTICKNEGILSFAAQGEKELNNIVGHCLAIEALPLLVFDTPETSDGILSKANIAALHRTDKGKIFIGLHYPDDLFIRLCRHAAGISGRCEGGFCKTFGNARAGNIY